MNQKTVQKKKMSGWTVFGLFILGFVVLGYIVGFIEDSKLSPHEKELKELFSSFDGSVPEVIEAVKSQMNDPESFEHVKTRYIDNGEDVTVIMTFRGKNGFGGVLTKEATAKVNLKGKILTGPVIN